jgi:glyoxylase-like metal-dependent hydrolase (beta-lactamase superfamily II)
VIVGHENLADDMQWLIRRQAEEHRRREIDRYNAILRDLRDALPRHAANRRYAMLIRSDLIFYDLLVQDLQEGYEVVPPSLTFSDRHTLDLDDLALELIFFGRGHSNSDILIYIPQERVLVTGAIAYQQGFVPEIGETSRLEDVHRFIAVLDDLLADNVKIDHVIPGHSVPLTRAVLPPIRDYYQRMLTEVEAARRQGLTLEETTRLLTLRAKFPAFRDLPPGAYGHNHQSRSVRNLWRILDEDQPPSKPEPAKP